MPAFPANTSLGGVTGVVDCCLQTFQAVTGIQEEEFNLQVGSRRQNDVEATVRLHQVTSISGCIHAEPGGVRLTGSWKGHRRVRLV